MEDKDFYQPPRKKLDIATTLTPKSLQALVLLRYRATTVGVALNEFFRTYQYDQGDSLELCRFEAMSLVTSIAEYNTTMPEHVSSTPDYATLVRIMLQYLTDWITVSSEIVQEIQQTKPDDLSQTGRQIVQLYGAIMTPPRELHGKLPSDLTSPRNSEPLPSSQIILNWFQDCTEWVSQIKSDIEAAWIRGVLVQDPFLSEAIHPLIVFLLVPSTQYMRWFLYFWKRHSTLVPRTDFHQTVGTPYMIPSLSPHRSSGRDYAVGLGRRRRSSGFWEASYYPVRGAWGSQETYVVLSELLRQNYEVGLQRVMSSRRLASSSPCSSRSHQIIELDENDHVEDNPDFMQATSLRLRDEDTESVQSSPQSTGDVHHSDITLSDTAYMDYPSRRRSCPYCPHLKPFTLCKDLDRHVKSIHSNTKFYCAMITCSRFEGGRPFNRVDNRDRHMKQAHGLTITTRYFKSLHQP